MIKQVLKYKEVWINRHQTHNHNMMVSVYPSQCNYNEILKIMLHLRNIYERIYAIMYHHSQFSSQYQQQLMENENKLGRWNLSQ